MALTCSDADDPGRLPAKKAVTRALAGGSRGRPRKAKSAGDRLLAEMSKKGDPVGIALMIRQAARVADRLERIDRLLSGDPAAWLEVSLPRSDEKRGRVLVEVRVDNLVVEERQQGTLFRHLVADIHKQRSGLTGGGDGGDGDDDLVD